MRKPIELMADDELIEELDQQTEWSSDDAFEFVAFDRGDNSLARGDYIAKLYAEAVRRGLREPLPPSPEDDPDFQDIKIYMESKGHDWCGGGFRQWGDGRRQIGFCSFEDAVAEWHAQFVEKVREINHEEMWGK